jgi:hypothetical protein
MCAGVSRFVEHARLSEQLAERCTGAAQNDDHCARGVTDDDARNVPDSNPRRGQ